MLWYKCLCIQSLLIHFWVDVKRNPCWTEYFPFLISVENKMLTKVVRERPNWDYLRREFFLCDKFPKEFIWEMLAAQCVVFVLKSLVVSHVFRLQAMVWKNFKFVCGFFLQFSYTRFQIFKIIKKSSFSYILDDICKIDLFI